MTSPFFFSLIRCHNHWSLVRRIPPQPAGLSPSRRASDCSPHFTFDVCCGLTHKDWYPDGRLIQNVFPWQYCVSMEAELSPPRSTVFTETLVELASDCMLCTQLLVIYDVIAHCISHIFNYWIFFHWKRWHVWIILRDLGYLLCGDIHNITVTL